MRAARRTVTLVIATALLLASAGCSRGRARGARSAPLPPALLVVVSFDGFRWDYPELHGAPALLELAREGARAELVPSFPSKTYPNHYTLVTGLRPEHHGIIANSMRDPVWNAEFSLADRSAVEDGRWWEGLPIWVTAERRGIATAASFWPGSEAEIQGVRPGIWQRYDSGSDDAARVDEMLSWLDRSPRKRPRLLLAYFSRADSAGHSHGPAAPQTRAAVRHVDGMLARLRAGVAARGLGASTNWVVVSDHGMTDIVPDQVIAIESFVDLSDVDVLDANVVGLLQPKPGREEALVTALAAAHPHLHAARKSEMPERLHYSAHRRIPPLVVWVDPGWRLYTTRAEAAAAAQGGRAGNHGYDPAFRGMHGIFVAAGPAFLPGARAAELDNVDVYELLCRLLDLPPAPNDGDPEATRWALRPEAALTPVH